MELAVLHLAPLDGCFFRYFFLWLVRLADYIVIVTIGMYSQWYDSLTCEALEKINGEQA